jgi:hypothetical protein
VTTRSLAPTPHCVRRGWVCPRNHGLRLGTGAVGFASRCVATLIGGASPLRWNAMRCWRAGGVRSRRVARSTALSGARRDLRNEARGPNLKRDCTDSAALAQRELHVIALSLNRRPQKHPGWRRRGELFIKTAQTRYGGLKPVVTVHAYISLRLKDTRRAIRSGATLEQLNQS